MHHIRVPDEMLRAADEGALFVINDSGGKDSAASGLVIQRFVPREQQLYVHATLGESEWPGALEQAERQAEHAGAAFTVVQAKRTFLEMVEARYRARPDVPSWPSPKIRLCTSELKRAPIESAVKRYAREQGFRTVVNVMGLRAQESRTRASRPTCALNPRLTLQPRHGGKTPGRTWTEYLPVHTLTREEVFGTIREGGLTPHPAYALGNDRVSCIACVMSGVHDLRNGALHNPAVYQKYARLERRIGWTFHPSRRTLPELTGVPVEE